MARRKGADLRGDSSGGKFTLRGAGKAYAEDVRGPIGNSSLNHGVRVLPRPKCPYSGKCKYRVCQKNFFLFAMDFPR